MSNKSVFAALCAMALGWSTNATALDNAKWRHFASTFAGTSFWLLIDPEEQAPVEASTTPKVAWVAEKVPARLGSDVRTVQTRWHILCDERSALWSAQYKHDEHGRLISSEFRDGMEQITKYKPIPTNDYLLSFVAAEACAE